MLKNIVTSVKGITNMGYGLEDNYKFTDKPEKINFEAYKEFLKDYSPEKVSKYSKVSVKILNI